MRWLYCAAAMLIAALFFAAPSEASSPTFAGVAWGSPGSKAKAVLVAKGFHFVKTDADGDLDFSGQINGQKVNVYEILTPAHVLVKTLVAFLTSDDEAIAFYGTTKDTLTAKYGSPGSHYEYWSDPYTDEDSESEHETALAVGQGHFSAFWTFSGEGGGLWMEITKQLTVDVHYESAAWAAELKRRQSSGNSVL